MTYTDPTAFTYVGAEANGADLDTYVLDNTNFLARTKPYCTVTRNTDYTIAGSGSFEDVTLDVALATSDNDMADGTGITITRTGIYIVKLGAFFETGTYNKNAHAIDADGRILCSDNLFGIITDTDAHLGDTSHPAFFEVGQTVRLQARRDGDDTKVVKYRSEDSPILSVRWYAEPIV